MTDTLKRPSAQAEEPRKPPLGLSPLQVVGGALAAVTAAVVSSFLGVAGTLIGAALGSVLTTVAGAFYTQSMKTARGRIASGLQTASRAHSTPTDTTGTPDAAGQEPVALTNESDESQDVLEVDTRRGFWARLRVAVSRVSARAWLGTGAVFLLAIVAITGFELATGKPVSATVTGSTSSGTTISSVVEGGSGSQVPADGSTGTEQDSNGTTGQTPTSTPTDGATQQGNPTPDSTASNGQQEPAPDQTGQADPTQTADPGQGNPGSGQDQQQPPAQQPAPENGGQAPQAPAPGNT